MKRLLRIIAVLVTIVLAGTAWLISTESGLRFLASTVDFVTAGAVRAAATSGRLLGPFHIEGLTITVRDTRVTIAGVDVSSIHTGSADHSWRIDTVTVRDLRIFPPKSREGLPPPLHLPQLRIPVRLDIGHARLDGLTVVTETNAYPIVYAAEGPLTWSEHRVDFVKLTTRHPQVHVFLSGSIELRDHWPVQAAATWRWDIPHMRPWTGTASLKGDFAKATAISRIETPFHTTLNGVAEDIVRGVTWRVNGTLTPQSLRRLNPAWPDWFLTGVVEANGKLADYDVRTNLLTISDDFVTQSNIDTRWHAASAHITRAVTRSPGYAGEAHTQGDIRFSARPIQFKLNTSWKGIAWPLAAQWLRSDAGQVRISGALDDYQVNLQGDATYAELPTINLTADGKGDAQHLNFSDLHLYTPNDSARAQGTALIHWKKHPKFDLGLRILRAAWPLDRTPSVIAHDGHLRIAGEPNDYDISFRTTLAGTRLPQGQVDLQAHGTRTEVAADRITLRTLDGIVAAHGKIAFAPILNWQIAARGTNINPERLHPQWPGALDFTLTANNTPTHLVEVNVLELIGTLRQQRVNGTARIEMTDQYSISFSPALLRLGDGYVLLEGDAGTNWALSWAASLPNLADINNELSGSLNSVGSLSGKWDHLRIGGQANARDIAWGDRIRVGEVQADVDADLSVQDPSQLKVTAKNLVIHNTAVELITLNGRGTGAEHTLDLLMQTSQERGTLHAVGTLRHQEWELRLKDGQIASPMIGNWRSNAPARWIVSRAEQRLEPWCWQENNASFCLRGSWHDVVGWHGEFNGNQIPLGILSRWLPPDIATSGGINITARADQTSANSFTARARLVSDHGQIRFQLAPQETSELAYRAASIDLMSSGRNIAARLNIDFPSAGFVHGNIGIVNAFGPATDAQISGELRAAVKRLDFIPALIPDIAEPKGEMKGVVRISGSLAHPSLTIHSELKGEARLPRPGLHLRQIIGRISGNSTNGLAYTVSANSGPGTLKAAGRVDLVNTSLWHTQLGITGTNFQIINMPEATALVSPDLALDISAQLIRIDGTVGITEAKLNLQHLENSITPSQDIVILGDESANTARLMPPLSSIVRIDLGDKIRVEGFGLNARLHGNLALIDEPNQPTRGVGQIMIAEGSYNLEKLYGAFAGLAEKEITINRGRLIFPNIPLADPSLDVRASRAIGEVTSGVTIRGTLQHPLITPFSVPVMSHSDALSYLLYGLPLSQASTAEGQALYQIATSAAASGSALLANQVIRILGLPFDSARVENNPTTGESFVVVGKYLSPRLYVSYGRGLAEQLDTFRLRYQLSSKWAIEADTSNEQQSGADIVYTLESGQ